MQKTRVEFYKTDNIFVADAYDRFATMISILKAKNGESLFTISGCEPSIGSTTVAISTAVSLAIAQRKVLLVDTDMRKHSFKKRLNVKLRSGLSDHLMGAADFNDVVYSSNIEHLDYIPCGSRLDNPVMLLNSGSFDDFLRFAESNYDYVIFDSPPLNATVDAGIIAAKTSGVVLVAGYMRTRTKHILSAKKELDQLNANIIGIILNHIPKDKYTRFVEYYNCFKKVEKKHNELGRAARRDNKAKLRSAARLANKANLRSAVLLANKAKLSDRKM